MDYLQALGLLHQAINPQFYLEIGCHRGDSLVLANCSSIAIDPEPDITFGLNPAFRIFQETSDEFFARPDINNIIDQPPDMCFIDGMHLVEFALRDFINLECYCAPHSVIVIDDVVPGDMEWTTRNRNTQAWTGDVYRLIPLLRQYRPDLEIHVFDATIAEFCKGIAIISNLNPSSIILSQKYQSISHELKNNAYCEFCVEDIRSRSQVKSSRFLSDYIHSLADRMDSEKQKPAST